MGGDPCGTVQPPPPRSRPPPPVTAPDGDGDSHLHTGKGRGALLAWETCTKLPPTTPRTPPAGPGWLGGRWRDPPQPVPWFSYCPSQGQIQFLDGIANWDGGGGGERGTGWGGDVGAPWAGVPVPGPPPHRGGRKQSCPAFPEDEDFLPPIEWGP